MLFTIIRTGNDFSCRADGGPAFFVGRRVPYKGNIGLYNIFSKSPLEPLNFKASDFTATYDFWAEFIEPTALCEGRNFLTLNSYDRARFTFGFAQFAAHVPDGDFVQYFREMLKLPNADDYFPHIGIVNGRISKIDGAAPIPLEDATSTEPLMAYLNPTLDEVEDPEVIASAKFIHWTSKDPSARAIQVGIMTSAYKAFVKRGDKRVDLRGKNAAICCVISDILHHGRGGRMTWQLVDEALRSANPLDSLLEIGAHAYPERIKTLRQALKARPQFLQLHWDRNTGAFA